CAYWAMGVVAGLGASCAEFLGWCCTIAAEQGKKDLRQSAQNGPAPGPRPHPPLPGVDARTHFPPGYLSPAYLECCPQGRLFTTLEVSPCVRAKPLADVAE